MALLDMGLIGKARSQEDKLKLHAGASVALFLVVAHIAMIFGMLDPALLMRMHLPQCREWRRCPA